MANVVAPEFSIEPLNLLAFPRNENPKCELTGAPATVQLVTPYCSLFYANETVAEQSWYGILQKIAHLLAPLLAPAPMIGTHDERAMRNKNVNMSKRSLIEFCLAESSNHLSAEKFQLAIPAATQALKFSKELEGDMSILVVEPYLQLGQASLGLKRYSQTQEYLSLAKWIVMNSDECNDLTRSRLHQLLGQLQSAQGQFDLAKVDFSKCIYFSSRFYGAESTQTSSGYFRLGDCFLAQGNVENALALFDKVVDVWYKFLSNIHLMSTQGNDDGAEVAAIVNSLSEENVTVGNTHISKVLETRRRLLGAEHIATGEAAYTLGLFQFFLLGKPADSEMHILAAQQAYEVQLGPQHTSTRHVANVLTLVKQHALVADA